MRWVCTHGRVRDGQRQADDHQSRRHAHRWRSHFAHYWPGCREYDVPRRRSTTTRGGPAGRSTIDAQTLDSVRLRARARKGRRRACVDSIRTTCVIDRKRRNVYEKKIKNMKIVIITTESTAAVGRNGRGEEKKTETFRLYNILWFFYF